jgi:hypothetical protein
MPAYNFQRQFVPMILNGSKPHTIRRRRKRPTVKGDRLLLYTGMRTKGCELITVTECAKVEPVIIYPTLKKIMKDGEIMPADAVLKLAKADGFDTSNSFFRFFEYTYGDYELDDFEIIWWDVDGMISGRAGEVRVIYGGV